MFGAGRRGYVMNQNQRRAYAQIHTYACVLRQTREMDVQVKLREEKENKSS